MKSLVWFVLLFVSFFPRQGVFAAQIPITKHDSIDLLGNSKKDFLGRMEEFFRDASMESENDLALDRALIRQGQIFEEIKVISRQARSFLKKGFDTLALRNHLREIEKWHVISGDGVFQNRGSAHTSRNLTATYNILNALQIQVLAYKKQVDNYQDKLVGYRLQIDSLSNDKSLFVFPRDSAELNEYIKKLRLLSSAITPINKQLGTNIKGIQSLQDEVNIELLALENGLEEILYFQHEIANNNFVQDFTPLWEKSTYNRPIKEIVHFSILKAQLVFTYYLKAHSGKLFISILILTVILLYVDALNRGILKDGNKTMAKSILMLSPISSSLFIGLSTVQFIFPNPPFVFSATFLALSALLLTYIFRRFISVYWMLVWLSIFILNLLAALDNMVLQASRPERYLMIVISILATICSGIAVFNKSKHRELQERWILFPISLMGVLEIGAMLFNLFGHFNFGKALMVSGLVNATVAIIFLWVIRLINEGLSCASVLYTKQERRLFYINYNRVGKRAPTFFYALLIVGWFILFGRNFYEFHFISEPIGTFFYNQHKLGAYSFSVINIVIFILIMLGAMVLSKVVSFFATDPQWNTRDEKNDRKFHLGSWILLVRISIIVLGLFLAFSAVGIPLQQITIVIGALGVGIGFGLQTLVNNLVSGLIIAFEKPVNVDDQIEIGGQSGKVKSIGFRSSVIATSDGADMIMPNGDLLNSHVINWTLGGLRKRLHIRLEVKYGTDLANSRQLLVDLFEKEDQVLSNPSAVVQFAEVTAQSVAIDVFFWVKTLKDAGQIKSDLLIAIANLFQANGIPLAIGQQEISILPVQCSKQSNTNQKSDLST